MKDILLSKKPKILSRKRYKFEYKIQLPASKDTVFPLLCPTREYEWFSGWECTIIYSDSGYAENNCLFFIEKNGNKKFYQVINYEPNEFIEFFCFSEKIATFRFKLSLENNSNNGCELFIKYNVTSLSDIGDIAIEKDIPNQLLNNVKHLEKDLIFWLLNGKKIA